MGACLLSSAVPSSIRPPSALPPAAWVPAQPLGPARALLQKGTMTPKAALALLLFAHQSHSHVLRMAVRVLPVATIASECDAT